MKDIYKRRKIMKKIIDSLLYQIQLNKKYINYLNNIPVTDLESELKQNCMNISIENGRITKCISA